MIQLPSLLVMDLPYTEHRYLPILNSIKWSAAVTETMNLNTVEPRYKELLYNKVLHIMNDFVYHSNSKIFEKEPQYNGPHYREQIFASPFIMLRFHCTRFTVLIFVVELQRVCTTCIHSDFWARNGASFKTAFTSVHEKKIWNWYQDKAIKSRT